MRRLMSRLLPLWILFACNSALAQSVQQPILPLGSAVVTGFSGTVETKPAGGKSRIDATFIDPDGASLRIIDIARPGYVWDGRLFRANKPFDVAAKDIGQVFGVALDDAPSPNIYAAATSVFGLNIVSRARDGSFERRKKGGPGAGWMRGQFGLELQGGPGAIYKVDGQTGTPTLLANVTLDGVPNPGPGLGNLAYDAAHKQLFVSDLYTGMIHRIDLDGRDLGRFDHGVTALTAAKQPPVSFDAKNRPNIATERFDSEKPETWGLAPLPRRVWGLAVHEGRLYYSVAAGPQIWSVGIAADGGFAADPRWELDVPAQAGPLPISDIAFSQKGAMILAQRALAAGSYDYSAFTRPGEPTVFRIWLKGPNDPPSPSRWKLVPEEYAVGFAGSHRNTNGGVALGYGYGRDGAISTTACEFSIWTTGQNLRNDANLRNRLEPGGPLTVHGIQGSPGSPVRSFNAPPWTSYFVDYDDKFDDSRSAGHMGSVRIYSKPCATPAAYGGPGFPGTAPYIAGPPLPPPAGCIIGGNCPPSGTPIDIGVAKIGEYRQSQYGNYNFDIAVRNLGGQNNGPQTLTITDVVPAGMTFTHVTATNWNCTPNPPITGGNTLTCTYTGPFPLAPSQLLGGIHIDADAGNGPFENCATLSGDKDGDPSNDKACVTVEKQQVGELIVNKIVDYRGPLVLPSQTYPVTVACGGNTTTFNLLNNVPQSIGGIPYGTVCTVTEPTPPVPASACPSGWTGTWTTTMAPPSPLPPINQVTTTVTVTNRLDCAKDGTQDETGYMRVSKSIDNRANVSLDTLGALVFPVTISCGGSDTTVNVQLTHQGVRTGIPVGTTCTATETLPPPPTGGSCPQGQVPTWVPPPTYTPPSVQITSGGGPVIAIRNILECKPGGGGGGQQVGELIVKKIVDYHGPLVMPAQTYPVTADCGGTSNTFNLVHNVPQSTGGIPYGAICTITEPTPPVPAGACPPEWTATWTTTMAPLSPLPPINQLTTTVTVTNRIDCKAPQQSRPPALQCRAPLVPNPSGTECVCRGGLTLRAGKCVEQISCRSPAQLNKAGTGCDCPKGMTKRGNSCVEPERKQPRITPDDVIRVVPGIIPFGGGRGGGGGGGGGGGAGGGGKGGGGAIR